MMKNAAFDVLMALIVFAAVGLVIYFAMSFYNAAGQSSEAKIIIYSLIGMLVGFSFFAAYRMIK